MKFFERLKTPTFDSHLKKRLTCTISASDFDHVESEVEHLFYAADTDIDGFLSRDEMVEKNMDVFVGSEALDFGDVLIRHTEF